ncbi:putative quinol monooxygenase [Breoghania corrubedonensis]|uniref:putative quinol monooxygenase n=1 Tax=Breoghania corrubedonensis TaxID=665038 RepID=UPI00147350E1|nr:antibiotic biosynthesis monooxygenase [Breoghania corrubedonensis]
MKELFSIVEVDLKPQYREVYLEAARAMIDAHRADPGLIAQAIHVSPTDPGHCIITIAWRDAHALKAHCDSQSLKTFLKETAPFVARPSIMRTYSIEKEQTLL